MSDLETTENPNLPGIPRAGFFRACADYWTGAYRRVETTHYVIKTPKLGSGQGIKIALVSDLHADTRFMPANRIREVVAQTNALGADLIVLGGDYLTQKNWRMTPLPLDQTVDLLSDLTAPMGVTAILGNHDWWDDPRTQAGEASEPETVALFADAGFDVMRNSSRQIGSAIGLAALDSQMAFERKPGPHEGVHDLDSAVAGLNRDHYNILLAHEPDIFADLSDHPVDVVLSGHTHGGQIRLFGARPVVPSAYGARYAYGHHRDNGRDLIVSGGLGCSSIPVRLGIIPEIVCVTLEGGA